MSKVQLAEAQVMGIIEGLLKGILLGPQSTLYHESRDNLVSLADSLDDAMLDALSRNELMRAHFADLPEAIQRKLSLSGSLKSKSKAELNLLARLLVPPDATNRCELFDRKGAALHLLGRFSEAVQCFDQAILLKKKSASLYFRRAEAKFRQELYIAAEEDYQKAWVLNEEGPEKGSLSPEFRSQIKLSLEKCQAVQEEYKKVLEQDPNHYDAHCRIARLYTMSVTTEESLIKALHFYDQAIQIEPNRAEGYWEAVDCRRQLCGLLGGDSLHAAGFSEVERLHFESDCDDEKSNRLLVHVQKGLEHLEFLAGQNQQTAEVMEAQGDFYKFMGDNHFKIQSSGLTHFHFFSRAEKEVEHLAVEADSMGAQLFHVLPQLTHFHTLGKAERKVQYLNIMKIFQSLIGKAATFSQADRRALCQAVADFNVGLKNYKAAIEALRRLSQVDEAAGLNSRSFCEQLMAEYTPLILEEANQKSDNRAARDYEKAWNCYQEALRLVPSTDLHIKIAATGLCWWDALGDKSRAAQGEELKRQCLFQARSGVIANDQCVSAQLTFGEALYRFGQEAIAIEHLSSLAKPLSDHLLIQAKLRQWANPEMAMG